MSEGRGPRAEGRGQSVWEAGSIRAIVFRGPMPIALMWRAGVRAGHREPWAEMWTWDKV